MIKIYICLHVKYPLLFSDVSETNFLDGYSKNFQITNFMKILTVGSELIPCGETDRHYEAIAASPNFAKRAHKKGTSVNIPISNRLVDLALSHRIIYTLYKILQKLFLSRRIKSKYLVCGNVLRRETVLYKQSVLARGYSVTVNLPHTSTIVS